MLDDGKVVYSGPPSDLSPDNSALLEVRSRPGASNPPPPTPLRRRFEKMAALAEPGNEMQVKKIPFTSYKEVRCWWCDRCGKKLRI